MINIKNLFLRNYRWTPTLVSDNLLYVTSSVYFLKFLFGNVFVRKRYNIITLVWW